MKLFSAITISNIFVLSPSICLSQEAPSTPPANQSSGVPVSMPTANSTFGPGNEQTPTPTLFPSERPTNRPSLSPTLEPAPAPMTSLPSQKPVPRPTIPLTASPTGVPTPFPSKRPTNRPVPTPTIPPQTASPTGIVPTPFPTWLPSPVGLRGCYQYEGKPQPNCECHKSCKACGYGLKPNLGNQCLACFNGDSPTESGICSSWSPTLPSPLPSLTAAPSLLYFDDTTHSGGAVAFIFAGIMIICIVAYFCSGKAKERCKCSVPTCPSFFYRTPRFRKLAGSDGNKEEIERFRRMARGSSMAYPSPTSSPMHDTYSSGGGTYEMTSMSSPNTNTSRSFV